MRPGQIDALIRNWREMPTQEFSLVDSTRRTGIGGRDEVRDRLARVS